ncbi:VacJ family lipoprotein [Campylobacter sp. RM13119]|uniref:MlaA family lipoprotein n=1 Tax=Campylobacter TaxID=194 RepID=UPI0014737471|nr:VacJ family lipoprotein [Campylobacter sp. RM13119]MBE3021980.1 VacJ family lipoprotein [Campylobacter sp. 7477a]MBE3606045.1 VacJ family lipoprotein [Campylobacter sp. RM13119]
MRFILAIFFSAALLFANTNQSETDEFDVEFGTQTTTFDPLSGYNRVMTSFNDFVYVNMLTPAARGYAYVVPKTTRTVISNFFDNLMFPIRFVNNLLQFKFKNAGEETLRFLANTIIGFGGLTDGAKYYGLEKHDEDFGQTLGTWGIASGFHVVLPLLGPSNLRDMVGMAGDYFANPISYIEDDWTAFGIKTFAYFNEFSHDPLAYENLKKDAVELYPFLRDAYEQRREHLIKE